MQLLLHIFKGMFFRSRALQIGMNLSVLEEWIRDTGLPRAVESHFTPVREMVHWLQVRMN